MASASSWIYWTAHVNASPRNIHVDQVISFMTKHVYVSIDINICMYLHAHARSNEQLSKCD